MNTFSKYQRLLILVALTTSSSLGVIQTANANTNQPNQNTRNNTVEAGANLLGNPQPVQRTSSNLNTQVRELPNFEVQGKPKRSKGILSVLGGRFVNEDRHPSFRKSTLKQ